MSLSGFESEVQIEERRKKRQEEWDRVRNADQPEEAPEEEYDPRSLYERLKEQRDKKDMDFEESKKFKNLVHTLDDDEIIHLNSVDEIKIAQERQQKEEELKEINEYRMKVAELQEISSEQRLQEISSIKKPNPSQKSSTQKSILSAAVKRKSENPTKIVQQPSAMKILAVLPGIEGYKSSDEDSDSDSSYEEALRATQRDLTGRQIKRVKHNEGGE